MSDQTTFDLDLSRRRLLAAIADGPALALAPHPDTCAPADTEWLEHSLRCADLVICQTGCVSHSAFWRVEDHCKRTGKTCVLVDDIVDTAGTLFRQRDDVAALARALADQALQAARQAA